MRVSLIVTFHVYYPFIALYLKMVLGVILIPSILDFRGKARFRLCAGSKSFFENEFCPDDYLNWPHEVALIFCTGICNLSNYVGKLFWVFANPTNTFGHAGLSYKITPVLTNNLLTPRLCCGIKEEFQCKEIAFWIPCFLEIRLFLSHLL